MNKIITWVIGIVAVLALVIGSVALVGGNQSVSQPLGGGTRFPNGISADSTSPSIGQVRGATLTTTGAATFGGNVTVTTSNTATSTAIVGCFQTYATSTATVVKFVLSSAGTSTATFSGPTAAGGVSWTYGACP